MSIMDNKTSSVIAKESVAMEQIKYPPPQMDCNNNRPSSDPPPRFRHWRTFVASVAAALASCSLGAAIGYTSPAIPDINSNPNPFHMDTTDIAIATSVCSLGGIVGEIVGGYLSDRYGRRQVLIFSSVPSVVGWVLVGCSPNVICMYIGRILNGFCSGIADIAVPVYVSEISEKSVRGFMCSCHEFFINIGMLLVFALGIFLHWNWLAIACGVIPVIMIVLLLFVPESPRWLLSNYGKEAAMDALQWLRGTSGDVASEELKEIEENVQTGGSVMKFKEFKEPVIYKPFGIIVGLLFFQQMAGYGVLPEYMVSIFQSAGADWNPYAQTAVVGAAGVVANIISGLVVDRAGRRVMLLVSFAAMAISIGGLASFFTIKYYSESDAMVSNLVWLPIVSLIAYNFGVALGVGPIPFYLSSELYPLRARSIAGSYGISTVWVFIFVTSMTFQQLSIDLDEFGLYWIMCGFAIMGFIFAFCVVPETKGRSLEAIEKMFSG